MKCGICGCADSDANWFGGVRKRDCLACCRNGVCAPSSRESDREDRLEHLDVFVSCFRTGIGSASSVKNCATVDVGGSTLLLDGSAACGEADAEEDRDRLVWVP